MRLLANLLQIVPVPKAFFGGARLGKASANTVAGALVFRAASKTLNGWAKLGENSLNVGTGNGWYAPTYSNIGARAQTVTTFGQRLVVPIAVGQIWINEISRQAELFAEWNTYRRTLDGIIRYEQRAAQ